MRENEAGQGRLIRPIAHIKSQFPTKFGIPRQSGLVEELEAQVIFEPEFRNEQALRGIEEFSHLWLIWDFSQNGRQTWSPTVRPPRLGGNTRKGVFATRSPFRPNSLGLSLVRLKGVHRHPSLGWVLEVAGADLMDGTPIYDVKPYLPHIEAPAQARGGFAEEKAAYRLEVVFEDLLQEKLPEHCRAALCKLLAQDPRPAYQEDQNRR